MYVKSHGHLTIFIIHGTVMKTKQNIDMDKVKTFITEVNRTKHYDRKWIAECHDEIFGKDERPGAGDPCPIMQMRKIKAWYQDQTKK